MLPDKLFKKIYDQMLQLALPAPERARIDNAPLQLNSAGYDPWGLHPETAKGFVALTRWLYHYYFRVETKGIEGVPSGRVLIVANHAGQIPLDGLLVGLALLFEATPPRVARSMVERWTPTIPFVGSLFSRLGQVVGDPRTCSELLQKEECVLVFPEGVRGSGKSFKKRYQLQRFGTGFIRLALENKTPIIPVGIIGTEETYPGMYHVKFLAKLLKAPYFPITPFFPLLGPLGTLPLPSKVTLRFGTPIHLDVSPDVDDSVVEKLVQEVKAAIQTEIDEGLKIRNGHVFTGAGK